MARQSRKAAALTTRLRQTPTDLEIYDVVGPLLLGTATASDAVFQRLMGALMHAGEKTRFAQLLGIEVNRKKLRFPVETLITWVEYLNIEHCHHYVWEAADSLRQHRHPLSKKQIIAWGLAACRGHDYRPGGCLLLLAKWRPRSADELWWLNEWSCSAAEEGNHGAGRLYPILLLRLAPKKRGRLSAKNAEVLAGAPAHAYAGKDAADKAFLPHFLLRMAHGLLRQKDFALVLGAFKAQVAMHKKILATGDANLKAKLRQLEDPRSR